MAHQENVRQFRHILDGFEDGLLFAYFGTVDQVSHMMWRARDPDHPAYDPVEDPQYAHVIEQLYAELDGFVGETLDRLDDTDTLIVLSDHGFASWRRSFHLNTWLKENGYLVQLDPARKEDSGLFGNVDWSRTRAYALGLKGLYVNLRGRERSGVVSVAEREPLLQEIRSRLLQTIDPKSGAPVVADVYRAEQIYSRDYLELAPDLVVGYAEGTRGSDESALGAISPEVIVDNRSEWSGDHCMGPNAVPGVLFSNRPLRRPAPSLADLPGAVLAEFDMTGFPTDSVRSR